MLEIPNMTEKEFLFNFMDNLQRQAEKELRCQGIQDLAPVMAVVESLTDYKKGDSSKVGSLKDNIEEVDVLEEKLVGCNWP